MKPAIIDIPGIGPAAAETLAEHHVIDLADLAGASVEKIVSIPGFSEVRANKVIAAAAELLAASGITQPAKDKGKKPGKKNKAGGKSKKDKNNKGKRKGKEKDKGKSKGKGKGKGKRKGKGKNKSKKTGKK